MEKRKKKSWKKKVGKKTGKKTHPQSLHFPAFLKKQTATFTLLRSTPSSTFSPPILCPRFSPPPHTPARQRCLLPLPVSEVRSRTM